MRRKGKLMLFAKVATGAMGRFIIVHRNNEDLAWSGSRWVPHVQGIPIAAVQVCNFTTRNEATEYIKNTTQTFA